MRSSCACSRPFGCRSWSLGAFGVRRGRAGARPATTELERRAWLLGESLKEAVEPLIEPGPAAQIARIVQRFADPGRGVAVYDRSGPLIAATPRVGGPAAAAAGRPRALADIAPKQGFRTLGDRPTYEYAVPLLADERPARRARHPLDATPHRRARSRTWCSITSSASSCSWPRSAWSRCWSCGAASPTPCTGWRSGPASSAPDSPPPPPMSDPALFGPLASEVSDLARSLAKARTAIAEEARLRLRGEAVWTEERLTQFARARLGDRPLVVVSNREPVSHVRRGRKIVALTPASGVVTAMEPVMRACGGVWVAHGSGDADREVVDERGMVRLPPDDPAGTPCKRAVALRGGGGRLLLRLRQRGPVAALPHRPRAADLPARGLAPVPAREREVRGRRARGRSPRRTTRPS